MKSIIPSFLRGARTFPEGGFVDEFELGRQERERRFPFNNTPEGSPVPIADEHGHILHAGRDEERYMRQPRDKRLKGELHRQRNTLAEEEINLVAEINDRLVKLQATRKAIRAIDAAGKVIVEEEKAYTPVQSVIQNKPAPSAPEKRVLEHVDTSGKVEEIEIDEAALNAELEAGLEDDKAYAKAC